MQCNGVTKKKVRCRNKALGKYGGYCRAHEFNGQFFRDANRRLYSDEQEFETARELIDFFLNSSAFRTKQIWDVNAVGRGQYIFRGQSNSKWTLTPSVFRNKKSLENFTTQLPGKYRKSRKVPWLGMHLHAELRAVFLFMEQADRLGIETPISYATVKDNYKLIDAALNDQNIEEEQDFPNSVALEELALAQHHGVPTRLLDWSESPLIATYFAAMGASSLAKNKHISKPTHITIICCASNKLRNSENLAIVKAPRHRNNFLRLQKGLFLHMPKANKYFLENNTWPSIENIICSDSNLSGALRKYTLAVKHADELLRILYDLDIATHTLRPTLDNVANSYRETSTLFDRRRLDF